MADASIEETYNRAGQQIGWRIRWRASNKRRSKSFGLKERAVAERFLAEVRTAQKSKARKTAKRTRKPSGATLADYFAKSYASKKTISRKTQQKVSPSVLATREGLWNIWIAPQLGSRPLRSISPADIEVTLDPRVDLTDDDVAAIIKTVPKHFRRLVLLQTTIGLRMGEAAALQVRDFDSLKDQLNISRSLSTRNKRYQGGSSAINRPTKTKAGKRRINLPKWLADDLRVLCDGKRPTDPVFTSIEGKVLRPDNFRERVWKPTRTMLGLDPSLTPHDMRHYAATRLLSEGVDVQEVCDMLGHQHVGVTDMLYRHVRPERRRGIAEYWERVGKPET